jgi:anthranilate phosphoribosyltransferase
MPSDLTWPTVLTTLLNGEDLAISEASWAMHEVMSGGATPAQLAGFLVALRAKGETVDEIVGFRDAILENAVGLDVNPMALDIVGTGGDRFGTVNVSTMASVVAAAAGTPVIKHGNRAASSSSGSSDVLAALGIELELAPDRVARVLDETGITFAFAAMFRCAIPRARRRRRWESRTLRRCHSSSVSSRPGGRPRSCSVATTGSTSSLRQGTVTSGRFPEGPSPSTT